MLYKLLRWTNPDICFGLSAWLIMNSFAMQVGRFNLSPTNPYAVLEAVHSSNFVMAFLLLVLVRNTFRLAKAVKLFATLCAFTFILTMMTYISLV